MIKILINTNNPKIVASLKEILTPKDSYKTGITPKSFHKELESWSPNILILDCPSHKKLPDYFPKFTLKKPPQIWILQNQQPIASSHLHKIQGLISPSHLKESLILLIKNYRNQKNLSIKATILQKENKKQNQKIQVKQEKLKKKLLEITSLYEASKHIKTSLNINKTLQMIIHIISRLLQAKTVSIMLLDRKTNELVVKAAKNTAPIIGSRLKMGEGIAGKIALKGKPVIISNIYKSQQYLPLINRTYQASSFLSVPLKHNNETIGIINITEKKNHLPFNQQDKKLIIEMANHIALALSHAHTFSSVESQALKDPLTNLYNRNYLKTQLLTHLAKAQKNSYKLAICMLDLDYFKIINDNYGHPIGDEVLKKISKIIQNTLRKTDIVARYGGEELLCLLPGASDKDSFRIAEKIRKRIEEMLLYAVQINLNNQKTKTLLIEKDSHGDFNCLLFPLETSSNHENAEIEKIWIESLWLNQIKKSIQNNQNPKIKIDPIKISISIGITTYPDSIPKPNHKPQKNDLIQKSNLLISNADKALYIAKKTGRNRCVIYKNPETPSSTLVPQKDQELETIQKILQDIKHKDKITYSHSLRVAKIAEILARALKLSSSKIHKIKLGALIHDIGKIFIDTQILLKPEKLTDTEYEIIKTHSIKGAQYLEKYATLHKYINAVKYHHEKWEGFGYPQGLAGNNIPLEARIIAIADSYDAMSTERPYKNSFKDKETYALSELRKNRDIMYEHRLVNILFENYAKIKNVKNLDLSELEIQ